MLLSLAFFLLASLLALDIVFGLRRLYLLRDLPATSSDSLVSIVVAARDEERGIEAAARSLLALRHPIEIIFLDDRSTDRTGGILDRLGREDPRLRVRHIRELPEGWLGKNHALHLGASEARGSWLLFTDADIVMEPETVTRALGYAEREGFDHLTVLPETIVPGFWLQAFVTTFSVWGMAASRPWVVRRPGNRRYLGVGAFNLVRRESYLKAGGHQRIPLRPDDDLKLGKILKKSGARTDVLRGRGAVSVEWYRSLGEAIGGLMKNSFSVVEYRTIVALAGALVYVVAALGPFVALAFGSTLTRIFGAGTLAAELLAAWTLSRDIPTPRRSALMFPIACLILCWVLLRATITTLVVGGIRWRGTFYPLAELKRNRV